MTQGVCSRCGRCCRQIAIGMTKLASKDEREYLLTIGAVERGGFFLIEHDCPQLRVYYKNTNPPQECTFLPGEMVKEGIAEFACAIYDHRPKICRLGNIRKSVRGKPCYIPDGCTLVGR
jgi:Fe-S-cluster containining protein